MVKLIMTKRLSGSGKSTWAKEEVKNSNGRIKRINKDDLREMLDSSIWSKEREKEIIQLRDELVCKFLSKGYDVIVDDTNLHQKHEIRLKKLAELHNAEFEIKDFTDVDVNTCIERDMLRQKPVGKKIIIGQYRDFLYQPPKYREWDEKLPYCIICDIDGTLAYRTNRSPFDYSKVKDDIVDKSIMNLVKIYHYSNIPIVLFSGRSEICIKDTNQWLKDNNIYYDILVMRKENDNRSDDIVKQEMWETHIKDKYNVIFVVDDRPRVIKMWKSLGLKVLNVGDNIDF